MNSIIPSWLAVVFNRAKLVETSKALLSIASNGVFYPTRNKFGFRVIRQRGSHIVLRKDTPEGIFGTVVPNHRELKVGTLKNILELAKVDEEEL